ncbi:MAG: helix-turn-helix domain-containing protein [Opitutales bacterium]
MSKQKHTFDPDYIVPPGATLSETIDSLGLTQKELAQRMGRPLKTINEIIKGVAAITAETALQLEKVTGIPASFWNNAEANYQERLARLKEAEAIQKQTDWLKRFSYAKMAALKLVPEASTKEEKVSNLLNFFGVAGPSQWESTYTELEGAARESNTTKSELGDLSAWLRTGEIMAQRKQCEAYSASKFKQALKEVRALTRRNPVEAWPKVVDLCAAAGVAVVLVPELPKTHVFGFTRWLTPGKALIQLSLRYKTDDMLWFTFFHEAAHILLHGKKDVFIEFRGVDNEKEQEANQWAANFLISQSDWATFMKSLPSRPTKTAITKFARSIEVADGIVLGRLQHRQKRVGPGRYNELKHKLEIKWSGIL